jgi:hypothetical protein
VTNPLARPAQRDHIISRDLDPIDGPIGRPRHVHNLTVPNVTVEAATAESPAADRGAQRAIHPATQRHRLGHRAAVFGELVVVEAQQPNVVAV